MSVILFIKRSCFRERVAMLKRSLAIFVCISMVGLTAVPASWLPCCCKSKAKAGHIQKSVVSSSTNKARFSSPGTLAAVHTCCSTKANPAASCEARQVLKKSCPGCRCLEQMQIVTVAGQSSYDSYSASTTFSTDRILLVPVAPGASEPMLKFTAEGSMSTLLLTCSFRC